MNSQIVQLTISVDRGAHDVTSVGNAVKRKRKYRSFDLVLCKLRLFLLRLRQSKLQLRQGHFEEISYFKIEAEEREFSNIYPFI